MARLDLGGLRDLWYRIDDVFARRTEAAHRFTWSGTTLTLNSAAGGALDSVNLNSGLASDAEAAHSLSLSNSLLVLKSVSGTTLATVSLSGLMQTSTANDRFGRALRLSGKRLSLINYAGTEISHVTLP